MSSDSQVTLSVIVPVHRVQGYLRECLHSILDEAGSNVEVIAIDDKSPDHCGEILEDLEQRIDEMLALEPPATTFGSSTATTTPPGAPSRRSSIGSRRPARTS